MILLQKILHFVMIFKVGLPSLNAFFSGPKSPNDKVSVLIRKRITCRFQKSSYFWFLSHFCRSYSCLKHRGVFFGTPCKYVNIHYEGILWFAEDQRKLFTDDSTQSKETCNMKLELLDFFCLKTTVLAEKLFCPADQRSTADSTFGTC